MGPVVTTAELRRGVVPYCVLATLASGSANAADIVRSLAARDNLLTSVGTVYPLLGRLERNGDVAGEWAITSGRPVKLFSLTTLGRARLQAFEEEWAVFARAVNLLLEQVTEEPHERG